MRSKKLEKTFDITLDLDERTPLVFSCMASIISHDAKDDDNAEEKERQSDTNLKVSTDKLVRTAQSQERKEVMDREFDRFKRLFGKFINEKGPSVIWDNIERLPQNAVRFNFKNFENIRGEGSFRLVWGY